MHHRSQIVFQKVAWVLHTIMPNKEEKFKNSLIFQENLYRLIYPIKLIHKKGEACNKKYP